MNGLFNITEYEKENILVKKRRETSEYCTVIVFNGYFDNGSKKWYWMLEDFKVFCKVYKNTRGVITDLYPCKLTDSFICVGRSIDPNDCIII